MWRRTLLIILRWIVVNVSTDVAGMAGKTGLCWDYDGIVLQQKMAWTTLRHTLSQLLPIAIMAYYTCQILHLR